MRYGIVGSWGGVEEGSRGGAFELIMNREVEWKAVRYGACMNNCDWSYKSPNYWENRVCYSYSGGSSETESINGCFDIVLDQWILQSEYRVGACIFFL